MLHGYDIKNTDDDLNDSDKEDQQNNDWTEEAFSFINEVIFGIEREVYKKGLENSEIKNKLKETGGMLIGSRLLEFYLTQVYRQLVEKSNDIILAKFIKMGNICDEKPIFMLNLVSNVINKVYPMMPRSKLDTENEKKYSESVLQILLIMKNFIVTDLTVFESEKNKIIFSVLHKAKSDGKVIVGCTTVDADSLSSLLASMTGDKTSKGFVVSSDGTTLLHTEKEKALKRLNVIDKGKNDKNYKDASNATKAALKKKNSTGSYELEGVEYVYGAAKVDYFDGTLFCTINTEEYSATSNKTLMYIFLSGFLMMGATVVVAWIFSRRISKPIMSATQRIRQLAQGNLSAPVDVWYSKDETGVLTSSLEETVVCLRQYINLITVALTQISEGNLQHRMEGTFKGDFQQIKNTFNEILEGLCDTFASINTAAEQVTSGAALVSNSAQSVSQGSTQQASAIEELSVTLKDVAKQVEQNSEDAKNAYNIVNKC